jgi:hypothetical protein
MHLFLPRLEARFEQEPTPQLMRLCLERQEILHTKLMYGRTLAQSDDQRIDPHQFIYWTTAVR